MPPSLPRPICTQLLLFLPFSSAPARRAAKAAKPAGTFQDWLQTQMAEEDGGSVTNESQASADNYQEEELYEQVRELTDVACMGTLVEARHEMHLPVRRGPEDGHAWVLCDRLYP